MAKFEFTNYGAASNKAFLGDYGDREHVLAGGMKLGAASGFTGQGDYTIHNTAVAAAAAETITVTALPVAVPAGTTLNFTGGKYAIVTTDAAAGATTLAVEPLAEQIADESDAPFDSNADERVIPAGTVLGQTFAEKEAGTAIGVAGDSDDEVFITFNEVDRDQTDDVDVVRHGTLIKVNLLPVWSALSAAVKAKVRAQYQTQLG